MDAGWLSRVLSRCGAAHHFAGGDEGVEVVRAWSVGGVQGGETLVQSRPVVRDRRAEFVADFLRAPSQTTLAIHAVVKPPGHGAEDIPAPRLGLARFQRWLGVRAESALHPDEAEAAALREQLRKSLPDFLQRALSHAGDRELTIFAFLGALHRSGDLNKPYVAPPQIRAALSALDAQLGRPARLNLFVCDGRTVGVIHRGGRLLMVDAPAPAKSIRALAITPAQRVQASLLLHDDGADSGLPALEGAEIRRVNEGIFTLSARAPGQIERE